MITSKQDYKDYYRNDLMMTGILHRSLLYHLVDRRYRFYKSLRYTEYITNCHPELFGGVYRKVLNIWHTRLCNRYGWTIPPNVFESGLTIVHVGTIVVSPLARVGKNCRIHVDVNIGNAISHGISGTPKMGDNIYIGPGAKIFGNITIGDNTAIGANAVVNKSFPEGNCTIAGIPATIVSHNSSEVYIGKEQDK